MTRRSPATPQPLVIRVLKSSASLKAWQELANERGWTVLVVAGWPYVEIRT